MPLNFLNPRPGTPFGDLPLMDSKDALRTIAAFRLALPRTILRYAGGRELTLGDLGTRDGLLGGINAVIVGNYLTTLGRDPEEDLALLDDLKMPIKALSERSEASGGAGAVLRTLRPRARRGRPRGLRRAAAAGAAPLLRPLPPPDGGAGDPAHWTATCVEHGTIASGSTWTSCSTSTGSTCGTRTPR